MADAQGTAELELIIRAQPDSAAEVDVLFRPQSGGEAKLATAVSAQINAVALRATELDPEGYGRLLSAQLFSSEKLHTAWLRARARADGEGSLRVLLRLTDTQGELQELRWERLTDPDSERPLVSDGTIMLARVAETASLRTVPPPPGPSARVLVVVAFPDGLENYGLHQFDLDGEIIRARRAVKPLPHTLIAYGADEETPERRATLANIGNALVEPYDIVYIVAHGTWAEGKAYLWLECDDGTPDQVNGTRLVNAIAEAHHIPSLVILACCLSAGDGNATAGVALGPALVQAGVPHVIAMQDYLSTDELKRAMPALFIGLQQPGASVEQAMTMARRALTDTGKWWLPVLYIRRLSGDAIRHPGASERPSYIIIPRQIDGAALEEAERRFAQLPTSAFPAPAVLPAGSAIPYPPNPLFVGRERELRIIAADFAAGTRVVGVTGLGGSGKTQIAIEFAHRYGPYFAGGVFWISCEDPAQVATAVAASGGRGLIDWLPNYAALSQREQLDLVFAAWQSPLPRLLIFDNCEDQTVFTAWRPASGGCRMLITSRRAEWNRTLGVRIYDLGSLERSQSLALLCSHRPDLAGDNASLNAIAAELGDLPLALHLAGSYLEVYAHDPVLGDPSSFLEELRTMSIDHEGMDGEQGQLSPTGHELSLHKTFAVSLGRLDPTNRVDEVARRMLSHAAYLAPGEPIPQALLGAALAMGIPEGPSRKDVALALRRLGELGLIDHAEGGALRLHRLLAAYVRRHLADLGVQAEVEVALARASEEADRQGRPADLAPILAHLRYVTAVSDPRADALTARLHATLSRAVRSLGNFEEALGHAQMAQGLHEGLFGPEHVITLVSMNNVGDLLCLSSMPEQAKPVLARVLAARRGPGAQDPVALATSLNNLGYAHSLMDERKEARELYEEALAIRRQVLGEEHPHIANTLTNIATLLSAEQAYDAARPYFEQALAIRERILGSQHPDAIRSRYNLALVLEQLAEHQLAHKYFAQTLQLLIKTFGPQHRFVAECTYRLGLVAAALQDWLAARTYLSQSVELFTAIFGPASEQTQGALDAYLSLEPPSTM